MAVNENVIVIQEGALGWGCGETYDGRFCSTVWFPADAEEDAREFATRYGYEIKENVPL